MSTPKRKMTLALLFLGALVVGAAVGSGCAIERGERSIVQPLALNKAQFDGTWYYRKTIVDAPYDAPGVFIGSSSDSFKIRWEITERYLYAFTLRPNVRNADSTVAPIAAWPIIGHFTVRHMISYSTGAPSNIIGEDYRDKPWYQRPHFRVAWERSVISDFTDFFWIYRLFGYVVREMPVNVRPEKVKILKSYMDFVTEDLISPGIGALIGKLNYGLPVSAYRVKYRHSFLKAKPLEEHTYTPRPMSDDQFTKFGYFRTTIINNHIDRGLIDWSYQYYANRHNIATAAELAKYEKENTAADKRKPNQIIYYLSPDFPENLLSSAAQVGADWNKAYQQALGRTEANCKALGIKEATCAAPFAVRANDHGLPTGQHRDIGDLRYNFLYWIEKPAMSSPLGYGPSFADTDTGQIISGTAYLYGAGLRTSLVNRGLLYYDMINGRYTDQDLRNGKDYLDIINNFGKTDGANKPLTAQAGIQLMPPAYKGFDIQKADKFVHSKTFQLRNNTLRTVDRAAIQARLSMIDKKPSLQWSMMSDDMLRSFFPQTDMANLRSNLGNKDVQEILNSYFNPANLVRLSGLRKLMEEGDIYSKHNVMRASYVDPALSKFVEANKDKSRAELEQLITTMIFRWVTAHEVGHTLGLRHNFSSSGDEANFPKEYFELKKKQGNNTPGDDKDARHSWYYMYTSVMDYYADLYSGVMGVGTYDQAALLYAYGNKLEVADTTNLLPYLTAIEAAAAKSEVYKGMYTQLKVTKTPLKTTKDEFGRNLAEADASLLKIEGVKADGTTDLIINLTVDDLSGRVNILRVHALFGVAPSGTRFFSDRTPFIEESIIPLQRRQYKFCSDELVGQDPYCNRFDLGSDPKQIVNNMIRRYDGTYPLRNWSRGRRYYRLSGGYLYSMISRFRTISDFYQNWMFRVINESGFDGSPEYYNQLSAISRGLGFISRVVHTPEPGQHVYDAGQKMYVPSPKQTQDTIDIPLGAGRYFYSRLQQDELGLAMYRFDRIGTLYDKYIALMTLGIRDWGLVRNRLDFFYVNFRDYFSKDDVTDMFIGAISGTFEKKFATTYKDKMVQPNWHPVLQYFSMFMAMTMLNSGFFGNDFTHYMTVAIEGNERSWTPPPGTKTVSFVGASGTRVFHAAQTTDGKSIAFKLVASGKAIAEKLKELRAAQPTSAVNQAEINRLEERLRWHETVLNMMGEYVRLFFDD